ncbi:hypothetical protein MRB53_009413 [Persea americana]|uniref:Uncharacterized protein n=1 Tax=Persea americana TaxID=3435 RepID=A0ACC2LP08_PERAE|nr:hypothetical protein MRB53_009413 [Persea americana]
MALQVLKNVATSHIVQVALDKVLSCFQNGFELLLGSQNHLVKIEDSLVAIHDFIVMVERSPKKDPKLMKLLEKLRDAAYDVANLLEEYEIEDRRRSEEAENRPNKVRRVVTSPGNITHVINRAQVSMKLKQLSKRLKVIIAEGYAFLVEKKVTNLMIEFEKQRETHSLVNKSQVFGRDEEKEKIVSLLLSPQPQVGDGVEDDELGNEVIERATRDNPSLSNAEELQRRLGETLSGKKFLLVLDDVWNEEPEKWYRLRDLLLCGGRGRTIVVTTRSPKVASIMSNIRPHILKPLSEDGCWSLFCQRAFGNPRADPNLEPIGRHIVGKCKGNPLAVTTVGGLLQDKRSERRWKSVRDSEMWSLPEETENGILPTLRLSYNYLRPHLKQCFAFCAIFPQNYQIEKELVIKLWMAHGFIPTDQEGLKELEDIGDEVFDELVMWSFFQDVKVNVEILKLIRNGAPLQYGTTFHMHGLMHDLVQEISGLAF